MVLWQHVPGKDAQFHTPLPQPTLKLQPLQMKCFFFFLLLLHKLPVFCFRRSLTVGKGEKSYFPLVSAALMIFVLVLS